MGATEYCIKTRDEYVAILKDTLERAAYTGKVPSLFKIQVLVEEISKAFCRDEVENLRQKIADLQRQGNTDVGKVILDWIKRELPGNASKEVELLHCAVDFSSDTSLSLAIEHNGIYSHDHSKWWSTEQLLQFYAWLKGEQ